MVKRLLSATLLASLLAAGLGSQSAGALDESKPPRGPVESAFVAIGNAVAEASTSADLTEVHRLAFELRSQLAAVSEPVSVDSPAAAPDITWESFRVSLIDAWRQTVPLDIPAAWRIDPAIDAIFQKYNALVGSAEFRAVRDEMISALSDPAIVAAFEALDAGQVSVPASFPPNPFRITELVLRNIGNTLSYATKTLANGLILVGGAVGLGIAAIGCSEFAGGGPVGVVIAVGCVLFLLQSGAGEVLLNRLNNIVGDTNTYLGQVVSALTDFVNGTLQDAQDAADVLTALGACSGLVSIPERMLYCIQLVINCPECYSFAVPAAVKPPAVALAA